MSGKPYERTPRALLREAKRRGKLKGEGCADVQYFPGGGRDTDRDAKGRAAAMLKAYDDGDPAAEWSHAPDWLSGEWADEPTPASVFEDCGGDPDRDPDGETAQEVADAYCEAASDAWISVILRHLRSVAQGED